MPDEPRPPRYGNEDDADFREWLKNRKSANEEVAPSVTFMEMMRLAAERSAAQRQEPTMSSNPNDLDSAADWTPSVQPGKPALPDFPAFEDGQQAQVLPPDAQNAANAINAATDALDETRRRRQQYRQRRQNAEGAVPEPPVSQTPAADHAPVAKTADTVPTGDTAPRVEATVDATAADSIDTSVDEAEAITGEAIDGDAGDSAPAKPSKSAGQAQASQARIAAIQRRRSRARAQSAGVVGGFIRSFILVIAAAGLMATMLTWFTPPRSIRESVSQQLSIVLETQAATFVPTATPIRLLAGAVGRRVGIVAGHSGPQNDPGAVCPDGLTEASVNMNVAQLVVAELQNIGYTVDLLEEFDPRMNNYQAAALVSIHANTCQDYGERVSGFLISAAAARITARSVDDLLVECVARSYERETQLARRPGVTVDMTDYHNFREIHPQTPAAIIELGFLRGDRELLTERPDLMARGITDGILCFLQPAGRPTSTAPLPTATATATVQP